MPKTVYCIKVGKAVSDSWLASYGTLRRRRNARLLLLYASHSQRVGKAYALINAQDSSAQAPLLSGREGWADARRGRGGGWRFARILKLPR